MNTISKLSSGHLYCDGQLLDVTLFRVWGRSFRHYDGLMEEIFGEQAGLKGQPRLSLKLALGRFHKSEQTDIARMFIPLDTESERSQTGHTTPRMHSHTLVLTTRKAKRSFLSWETSKKILLPLFVQ